MSNNEEQKRQQPKTKQIDPQRQQNQNIDQITINMEDPQQNNRIRIIDEDDILVDARNKKYSTVHLTKIPLFVIAISLLGLAVIIFAFITESRANREIPDPGNTISTSGSVIQNELNRLEWVEQMFLPANRFSRPETKLEQVNGIVIHNIGNPSTTALQNRNYFANVVPEQEIFASAHFIVCLDGAIIQCIPVDEIAYASNARNVDTISIEICHPDETGRFTNESYAAAIRMAAWISIKYNLTSEDIIRHFDVERESAPKLCPLYFVENEDAWERFKADVQRAIDRG